MTGVRMGERLLQIGLADASLAGMLAAKTGLSGHAVIVVPDDAHAARAQRGCADRGALADVHVATLDALPLEAAQFDVAIVHGSPGAITVSPVAVLRECHRVLRPGGRVIVIEGGRRSGLIAWLGRSSPAAAGGEPATDSLRAAGFLAVRLLADREGLRFTEGLKRS